MVLGILATHAFDLEGRRTFDVLLPTAVFLLLIPSIDETIQLFVPGRAGMITDVMIDCCGATTGVVLRYLLRSLMYPKRPPRTYCLVLGGLMCLRASAGRDGVVRGLVCWATPRPVEVRLYWSACAPRARQPMMPCLPSRLLLTM